MFDSLPVYVFVFVDISICPFYVCIWFCQCLYLYFRKLNVLFGSRRCLKSQGRNSISPSKVWSSQIMISRRDQSIYLSSKQTQCACFHAFKKKWPKNGKYCIFLTTIMYNELNGSVQARFHNSAANHDVMV